MILLSILLFTMRILFHYTHKQTLGHTTRTHALVKSLCRHKAQVLLLQGGLPQPFVRFPKECKILDIPEPFDDRRSFQWHQPPVSAVKRAQFILKTAADFCPDVFITEFFPFGRMPYIPELLPVLRFLRKKNTRIIASIGYPLIIDLKRLSNTKFAALHQALFAFYETFLIHTPGDLETTYIQNSIQSPILAQSYALFMKKLKKKIIYTGYVFPEKMMTKGTKISIKNKKNPTIIISRGGGSVYPKLITKAIEAQRLLDNNCKTIIACGPATTPKEMALFKACLKQKDRPRVVLTDHINNLDDVLKTCSVSVSLCGYNTSVQLMRFGTPSVIVPYKNNLSSASTNDQIARSKLLVEHFSSICLDHQNLTAKSLALAIKEQLRSPRPQPAPEKWFNGAEACTRYVMGR
ncbi:MAG: hypothetical protein HQL13_00250 [Candidatus Omnitrophica bacterium]|nr:hypothetical protein [Candidatus Omnitrophota bacterium]